MVSTILANLERCQEEVLAVRLRNSCNPNHMIASGWITAPAEVSIEEAQAAKLFYATGAWH